MTDDDAVARIKTPTCPGCGESPVLVLTGNVQAFCGNDNCRIVVWNPSVTAAENLGVDLATLPAQ